MPLIEKKLPQRDPWTQFSSYHPSSIGLGPNQGVSSEWGVRPGGVEFQPSVGSFFSRFHRLPVPKRRVSTPPICADHTPARTSRSRSCASAAYRARPKTRVFPIRSLNSVRFGPPARADAGNRSHVGKG
eukprot:scaffold2631_cov373-Pavlova_lutheri.AAC.13